MSVMTVDAIGSGFLNNTPLVAMMIPIIRDLARTTGLAPSKLLSVDWRAVVTLGAAVGPNPTRRTTAAPTKSGS
jgi:Na+/H+ antiporter NhaD/arsenite permease-like protein